MGFRKDAWATCWGIEVKSDTLTQVKISTSRKDKQTDEYVQDFSGFVAFVGTATAKKATSLKEKDRIKLGDVDVTTKYDRNKKVMYVNYKCYNFSIQNETQDTSSSTFAEPQPTVDSGDIDDSADKLPF